MKIKNLKHSQNFNTFNVMRNPLLHNLKNKTTKLLNASIRSHKNGFIRMILPFVFIVLLIASCKSYNKTQIINNANEDSLVENDTVSISSDESDYEIIIIEPGFNSWLLSSARPEGFHSQQWLESRNIIMVQAWNQRNMQPSVYDPNLYELRIDYDANTDYGYEVNYKLYNYFLYFQIKYKQRLSSFIPRI